MPITIFIVKGPHDERAYVSTWEPSAERIAALRAQGYEVFSVITWLPVETSAQKRHAQVATRLP
jgi:hypothetical protein